MALKQFTSGERLLASDLNSMVDAIQITEITWSNLKTLRDTSKLIPGATYRITDYTCTTVQEETKSAGHVFDILVTADDVNVLNENAHAIQHSGDTYFENSDLSAWELKYCLDNDTTRFAWADDSGSGRGVVYYMKDEFNNECPYDFKNIQYNKLKSFTYIQWSGTYFFTRDTSLDEEISGVTYYGYHCSVQPSAWSSQNCFVTDSQMTTTSILYTSPGGETMTYGKIGSVNLEEKYGIYTFSVNNSDIFKDGSLLSSNIIYSNVISNYINTDKLNLNRIWFIGNNIIDNTFGTDCHDNTFGNSCYSNTFGNNCQSDTFGNDYIYYCTFFDGVQSINVSITATNTNKLQNMQVLNGTKGTSSSKLQITGDTYVTAGRAYTTTIGKNSSGTLTSKVLMDA